jgi:hypothetical protein
VDTARLQGGAENAPPFLNIELSHFSTMGMTAMALGLIVLTLAAGCLLWILLLHFEEFYSAAEDGILLRRRAKRLFLTLTGLLTVGILGVLFLEFQQLGTSYSL